MDDMISNILILILFILIAFLIYYNRRLKLCNNKQDYLHFKDFLDSLNIPICIKDAYTQDVYYINDEYKKILIHTKVGKDISDLVRLNLSKESFDTAAANEREMIKNNQNFSAYLPITLSNGKTIDTYTNKSIIKWEGENRILCVRYDLSQRQRTENMEKLISRTIPSIQAFSWEMDSISRTIQYNYGNTCFSGIERFDTLEKCIAIIHPDDRAQYEQALNEAIEKGDGYFSVEYRSRINEAKSYHWWELRCIAKTTYSADEKFVRLYGLNIYTNVAKQRELQLVKQSKELELAKNKAEESDKLKSAFLANMSHEIRTPLNAIVGFSELLIDSTEIDEREEYFNIIKFNNEILLKLVNDIIDLSKIEAGVDLKPTRGSFVIFFNQVAMSLKKFSNNPDVELIIDNPYDEAIATIDFTYLAQIITNYTTNAIKNTIQGRITVGYSYNKESEMLEVYVKDTGIGIPADKQDVIFERFQKLDQYKQGAGLGLNIVSAIAEQLGFICGFESNEDVGSYFYARGRCPLFIPTLEQRQETTPLIKDGSSTETSNDRINIKDKDKTSIKILVAEDTDSNYDLVRVILEQYQLSRALNGYEAVILAKENDYDLILMDIRMPLMDGFEATREIRKLEKDVPIVALSANTFDTDKIAAYEAGCDAYLEKPMRKQEIIEMINNLTKNKDEQ